MANQPVTYKYTSTKEYHDAFPCAYRQWRADSHCNLIHGYSFSMKFYFGTNDLDVRNWAMDYGGLKPLKQKLEEWFDHTLLLALDDPHYADIKRLSELGLAKITDDANYDRYIAKINLQKKFLFSNIFNRFTIADAYLHIILSWFNYVGLNLDEYPTVSLYYQNISNYDLVKKAKQRMSMCPCPRL